jgi:hypothetical protein
MNRITALLLVSCSVLIRVAAADVRIGDVSLHLPQPAGYCELDPVLASDARLVSNIHAARAKAGSRLLVLSAVCAEVKDWRNGKRKTLEHVAEYQTLLRLEHAPLPDIPQNVLRAYCDGMRVLSNRSTVGMPQDAQERADQLSKMLRPNETVYISVVAESPLVCYTVTLQKFEAETGEATQVTVFASTILKDKVVLFYLFAPYRGHETIPQLLATQRANMVQLQQANRD